MSPEEIRTKQKERAQWARTCTFGNSSNFSRSQLIANLQLRNSCAMDFSPSHHSFAASAFAYCRKTPQIISQPGDFSQS